MKTKPRGPKKTFDSERKISQRMDRLKMMDKKFDNKKTRHTGRGPSSFNKSDDRKRNDRGSDRRNGRR